MGRNNNGVAYPTLLETVIREITELWRDREAKFMDALESSPKKKLTLVWKTSIDCSKSDQNVDVDLLWNRKAKEDGMEIKKTYRATISETVDDPNAPRLLDVTEPAETEAPKKRRGRKPKAGKPADQPEPEAA